MGRLQYLLALLIGLTLQEIDPPTKQGRFILLKLHIRFSYNSSPDVFQKFYVASNLTVSTKASISASSLLLPKAEDTFSWPLEAAKHGDWEESAKRWIVLQQAYPHLPIVWFSAINAHILAGSLEAASELLSRTSERFPNHPNVLLYGAKISLHQNQPEIAAELLTTARKKFPDKLETWLESATCAAQKGLYGQAEQFNIEAQHRFPENMQPLRQHAELAMMEERWQEALNRWKNFRQSFPDQPAGYLQAAKAAEKAGQNKLARKLKLAREYGDELLEDLTDESIPLQTRPVHRHATLTGLAELVWTKAIFNLRSESQRNYLSYLWWILEPLLHMVVYFLVFGFLLQRGGEGFTTFLLTGLIPYMWFNKAMSAVSNSIIAGQGLMLQVGIPSVVFPLVSLLQATLKQIPVFAVLLGFVWLQGHTPNIHWWALFPVISVQLLLTVTLGTLLAALIPFIRDVSYLVPTGLTFLMFLSGVFYSYESIPPAWQNVFLMNPIAFLLKCYREVLVDGIWPNLYTLGIWALIAGTGLLLSLLAYKKLRYIFPRVVLA